MKKLYKKWNNNGSTLITVIICLAIIGILGSMMLSVTMTNLQMKIVESKSRQNFYSCEVAIEEIRTGLQEITADQIKKVYEGEVLKNFATYLNMTEADRNKVVQTKIAIEIIKLLSGKDVIADSELKSGNGLPVNTDKFNTYLTAKLPEGTTRNVTAGNVFLPSYEDGVKKDDKVTVVVKNIGVELTKNDYRTTISSDIIITIPTVSFNGSDESTSCGMEQPYKNYALLADGYINSNSTGINKNEVNGSIYAGTDGIMVTGSLNIFNISGADIVTRGNITAEDAGIIKIRGITAAGEYKPAFIWADNLMTKTTSAYALSGSMYPSRLTIDGICLIKDDLTLDGLNSIVNISGAYVGYTGIHTAKGSSIIVNGAGSSLDLSGLKSLILAGRAHISVEHGTNIESTDILTGESVALKSNQKAYLIPGEYIMDINNNPINHNPVTQSDINSGNPKVNLPLDPYDKYVDLSLTGHPYKIAAKQTGETLRYYYFGFPSGKQADAFLQNYCVNNPGALDAMAPFQLGDVELPDSSDSSNDIACVGNLTFYDSSNINSKVGLREGMSNSNEYPEDSSLDTAIKDKSLDHSVYTGAGFQYKKEDGTLAPYNVGMLDGLYTKINHLLYLDSKRAYQYGDLAVTSSIKPDGIDYICNNFTGNASLKTYSGSTTFGTGSTEITSDLIVVNGDVNLNCNFTGLMVSGGNVIINDDVKIDGMILAKGDITVGNNVKVTGRLAAQGKIDLGLYGTFTASDGTLAGIFNKDALILEKLFNNPEVSVNFSATGTGNLNVDLSSMISYDNWHKN